MITKALRYAATLLLSLTLPELVLAERPAAPAVNPALATSAFAESHAWAHASPLAGPQVPSKRLSSDEIQWKPVGPNNGFVPLYSSPYPNGKRVVWVGGYDRISKLDADTLEVLTSYAIGGNTYFGPEELERHIANMDKLDYLAMIDYRFDKLRETFFSIRTFYRMLSHKNELYVMHQAADGSISIRVYGEADPDDPASIISLRREWKVPADLPKAHIWGIVMTSDGWVVTATEDGKLIVLSQDFTEQHVLQLPNTSKDEREGSVFGSFLRNAPVTDDRGGIYVVTRELMYRVQWTGGELSLDEADGAWSAPYPNELGIGSGTTPSLMGWGPEEDHLVIIADGSRGNNMMAFWRDEIPEDWQGLPGFDQRVAGSAPVHFGTLESEKPQVENSIVIHGYGAFIDNFDTTPENLPIEGDYSRRALAGAMVTNIPGYEPLGGTMIKWDPVARELKTAWTTPTNFAMSICTVSRVTNILYCWGARDGEWTLEAVDWNTGENKFHYIVGSSQRFNPWAGLINIAPNGAIECGCIGGLGLVRITPKQP